MEQGDPRLLTVVAEARARLRRIAGREFLARKAWWVLGAGAAAAAVRPFAWRLADEAPLWVAFARSAGLFAAGAAVAAGAIVALGRRRGPSEVGAARAVDEALGLSEVVASGLAFVREGRDGPVVNLARRRAGEAAKDARPAALFPLPSLRPAPRAAAVFALGALLGLAVGGYERGIVLALLSPPSAAERDAAAELSSAAAELADHLAKDTPERAPDKANPQRDRSDDKLSSAGPSLADKARDAARAARRGDRKGALEKLEELRSAGAKQASRAGEIGATLRKVAEALSPSGDKGREGASAQAATPSKGAAESMRLLADKMRSPEGGAGESGESRERTLERLERAGEEARRAAGEGKDKDAGETARALSRAAEALKRGDRAAAAEALEQAAERASAMEQMREAAAAEAMAVAEMLEKSGALERAIQMAMLGKEGSGQGDKGDGMAMLGEGQAGENGEGQQGSGKDGKGGKGGAGMQLRNAILARLAAMGMAAAPEGATGEGSGPHIPDRHRGKHDPIAASGAVRAPSQVGEGQRAIQAINGLGRGTEPPAAYREVFPSYDAAAEEGIADERIPAQRRAAVRRYFQAIRPE